MSEMTAAAAVTASQNVFWLRIALDVPLDALFDYRACTPVPIGQRVIAPFGRRKLVGLVVAHPSSPALAPDLIKAVEQVLDDLPPLPADWLRLAEFAARYYQRPLGEVMLPALPMALRKVSGYRGKRSAGGPVSRIDRRDAPGPGAIAPDRPPPLNADQARAVEMIEAVRGNATILLYGVTGSGKTEVYMRAAETVLKRGRQVLFMVPEINLTPQLERALRGRFAPLDGSDTLVVLNSGLSEGERLRAWLAASRGRARILLGTRLAIFAPMPDLGLIIVDEEHDGSYKQQEGLRYSARDLAVWRGNDLGIPVVLGSATPALESWYHARRGHYSLATLPHRARPVEPPAVRLVDTRHLVLDQGFSSTLIEALGQRLGAGQQSLIFLNRRGYAPVLNCQSCGWVSQCPRCTACAVLHRRDSRHHYLQCHHCGYRAPAPRACPTCGDPDLRPIGRGTQRVEEKLRSLFPSARVLRIDADSTRRKGGAEQLFAQVHAGDVDIMVGTQMVSKGHDFTHLGLVGVLNADAALFASDFRAPERLFAQLMQVAGRAGRRAQGAEVIIQTGYPDQAVYQALARHDYVGFANYSLAERAAVGLPPYAHQALLTAEATRLAAALDFLGQSKALPEASRGDAADTQAVVLYDPVPVRVVRVANVERAQLLVESRSRLALRNFLGDWSRALPALASAAHVRYRLEVDPLEI